MITSIKREFNLFPNIVGIVTTDDLATITTAGYFSTQLAQVELLNNGVWQWETEDIVLIFYATDLIGWFTYDAATDAFVSVPANGGISNTLPSADIIVGNASNIATAVPMSGDVHISNTGATTIQAGAVTGSKIANNAVDYAQLALDVAQVESIALTSAQIKALYATPLQILPAPGAGKLIIVDKILYDYAFGTLQYTAGGNIFAQFGNTTYGAGPQASAVLAAATFDALAASSYLTVGGSPTNVASASSANTALYLANDTAAFATGDGTMNVYVFYKVYTPA